jgi:hypothetical protein
MSLPHKTYFTLPHDPLTPVDPETTPTAWTIRQLRNELYANAQSVESTLGGGQHGHMGMVMPDVEYITVSAGAAPYVLPIKPAVPVYAGTAANRHQQQENFKARLAAYQEAQDLQNKLKTMVIQAVPAAYLAKLREPLVNYANATPKTILAHLMAQYGAILPADLKDNMERLQAPWNPDTPIDLVFNIGIDCRHFATEGGNPINDAAYLEILLTTFRKSGVMDDAINHWGMKDTAAQTLDNAILHFTKASNLQRQTKAYLKETMAANQVTRTQGPTGPPPRPLPTTHPLHGFSYCWTHGVCTHGGPQCRSPKTGHIPTATLRNPEGGSTRVYRPFTREGRGDRGRGGGRTQNKRKATGETEDT